MQTYTSDLQLKATLIAFIVLPTCFKTSLAWNKFESDREADNTTGAAQVSNTWIQDDDSWNYWWTYAGVSGPDYWGLLNPDWFMCAKGKRQSPVDIQTHALVYDPRMQPLRADKNLISGILFNDGHAIVFNGSVHWNAQRQKQHLIQNEDAKNDQNSAASQQQQNTSNPLAVALQSSSRLLVSTTNLTDEELLESAVQLDHRTRPKRTSLINTILVTGRAGTGAEDSFNDEVHKVDEPTGGASSVSLELEKLTEGIDIGIGQAGRLAFISGDEDDRVQPEVGEESMVSGAFSSMAETQNQADQSSVIISGADLAYDYKFEAFYLRFGSQNSRGGSEHQVNSHSYAGELQMISYNSQLYRSFNEAVNKPNGVMAIAILIDIAPIETPPTTTATATSTQESNDVPEKPPTTTSVQAVAPNAHLEQLLSHIDQLKHRTSMVSIGALNVSALLSDSDQFVAYEGSLTTPGCYESVHWLILNRPLYISQRNIDKLRSISADERGADGSQSGTMLSDNIRPVQPIHGRPIRTNIRPQGDQSQPETCQRLWTSYSYRRARRKNK